MKQFSRLLAAVAAYALLWMPCTALAQVSSETLLSLSTPDKVETRIGTLKFKDGAPTVETAEKVRDTLDFTRALNAYNNSFRGASAYALGKGFQSIGAEDNTIVIFSELMDSKSLFLTANADTVYYLGVLNLEKGPMVLEQPPMGLGTLNDMWFSWIIDIGFPGPDRGEGGKYLLVPPGYDGPLPEGGFFIAHSSTVRVLYGARSFLVNNDPKPTVELIKKTSRSIRTRREAMVPASRRRSRAKFGSSKTRPYPRRSSWRRAGSRSIPFLRPTIRSSR